MAKQNNKEEPKKQLWLTSWAINNKSAMYLLVAFLTIFGLISYQNLPKEQFPEVVFPQILVTTVYPGASPTDVENLISKHIEEEINTISSVRDVNSNSIQDFSTVIVTFETDEDVDEAKDLVQDAVDKAKSDLPNDLDDDPQVKKVEINDLPIMYVNISGDFDDETLKEYAEMVQDDIETLNEINRVDMVGAREREVQINVDLYRLHQAGLALTDVQQAIAQENVTISGGNLELGSQNYSVRVVGEFDAVEQMQNMIIRSPRGASVYLRDIADVNDTFKAQESYARLDDQKVITLSVVKRGGENLIETSDKIKVILDELQETKLPKSLDVSTFGDTSTSTRTTLNDLVNTIIIGFFLVTLVLMFFMGVNNALFVGAAVPLSAFITFMIIPGYDFTLNTIVLFSLLMALGILVDNAIVVAENTYRIYNDTDKSLDYAAKYAPAEVFAPVLSGILTTLAPFFPLLFWPGVTGSFMFYLPATLITTLAASLFVAFVINPVFAASFMKVVKRQGGKNKKPLYLWTALFAVISVFGFIAGNTGVGTIGLTFIVLVWLTWYVIEPAIEGFQKKLLPALESRYEKIVSWAVRGKQPGWIVTFTLLLFVASIMLFGASAPKVSFFPEPEPHFSYVYVDLPVGTDTDYTDSIATVVANKVQQVVAPDRDIIDAVLTNVAVSAGDPSPLAFEQGTRPEKAKVTVSYVEYQDRKGKSTSEIQQSIREAVKGTVPGATVTVEQESSGPPTGKPINIEVRGDDYDQLVKTAQKFQKFIESKNIPGIEGLQNDLVLDKPEAIIKIDRERANRNGIKTATIGNAIRTAINGNEVSKFREDDDQYPIILRLKKEYRESPEKLRNMRISFLDMASGQFRQIPLSSVADIAYTSSYGAIKRKNLDRIVTISSEVLEGYTANEIVAQIRRLAEEFDQPEGIAIELTGEQEDQKETTDFLGFAMALSLMMILFILTASFNSLGKTFIILTQVLFSVIGVFLGYTIFGMEMIIVMTGVGIIALAGIVVNNGILLVEFTDLLKGEGSSTRKAVIEAGKVRLKPVLLTAVSTMLGLIPLAVGLNIDFYGLFWHGEPNMYLGGDNVVFWGPLSWTIIFGLLFSTVLTLVVVPALYVIYFRAKVNWKRRMFRWKMAMADHEDNTDDNFNSNGHAGGQESEEEAADHIAL